jgi:hypothetical protein
VNAGRSLTRQSSLPSSAKRFVEKICDKALVKIDEADKVSLICLDELEMLPVQDYQPRIRFRLDDAVTVLETIVHVDNQQLGNFFQRDMENIVNSKVQKLEAAFTAQMKTLIATKQKPLIILHPLPLQTTKGQRPRLKMLNVHRSGNSDVFVQNIVATAGTMISRGAQMLVRIQALMLVRSKREKKAEAATDTDAKQESRPVDL